MQKLSQNFDFCTCPSHNALERDAGVKKGKLLCCKCIFDWIKGNLAEIQPKNHQNVQKTHFLQNVPGVNGLIFPYFHLFLSLLLYLFFSYWRKGKDDIVNVIFYRQCFILLILFI